jgi:hypothetical protein
MFFEGYTANQLIVGLVGIILVVAQELFPGISILKYLKNKWYLEDNKMRFLVIAFFMLLAAGASYLTGELEGWVWTLKSMLEFFGWFYIPANVAYQMLKDENST